MEEKRVRGERLRTFIDLTVEGLDTNFRAATADISASGMRLVSNRSITEGANYTFTLRREPHLILRGEVRWVEHLHGQGYRAGVHFVRNPAEVDTTLGAYVEAELNTRAAPGRPQA